MKETKLPTKGSNATCRINTLDTFGKRILPGVRFYETKYFDFLGFKLVNCHVLLSRAFLNLVIFLWILHTVVRFPDDTPYNERFQGDRCAEQLGMNKKLMNQS